MGEFDDVLAMEPGDEWDDHVPGSATPDRQLADLVATLRLPNALVDLRGEVPTPVLDTLVDLRHDDLEHLGAPRTVTLTIERSEGDDWQVVEPERGVLCTASDIERLTTGLVELLAGLAVQTDASRVHLDAACVVVGRAGVLLTEVPPESLDGGPYRPIEHVVLRRRDDEAHTRRAEVVAGVLELGAQHVALDLVSLLPGSRTVFGHPAPLGTPEHPPVAASVVTTVAPVAQVDHVVLLRRRPGAEPELTSLHAGIAAVGLLSTVIDLERVGPGVLDVLGAVLGGSRCWLLDHDDPAAAAAVVAGLDTTTAQELTVTHRLDAPATHEGAVDGRHSARVVRIGERGALFDGATGLALALDPAQLDAVETLLVSTPTSSQPRTAGAEPPRTVLDQLVASGIQLPARPATRRQHPGVDAYGLPNCPAGSVARGLWGDVTAPRGAAAAQAVIDGVAQVPDAGARERLLSRHHEARAEIARVESALAAAVVALGAHGIVPIVLGGIGHAHDGPLPPEFDDAEQVDLLVDGPHLGTAVAALVDAGLRSTTSGPGEQAAASTNVQLIAVFDGHDVTVRVHSNIAIGPFGELVDHDEFHGRSVPVRVGGLWCRTLHPEDRFVLSCIQLSRAGAGVDVQALRDVVLSAPRLEPLMAEALEASERWAARAEVLASLRRVHEALPGLSPWLVERAHRDEARARRRPQRPERKARRGIRRSRDD